MDGGAESPFLGMDLLVCQRECLPLGHRDLWGLQLPLHPVPGILFHLASVAIVPAGMGFSTTALLLASGAALGPNSSGEGSKHASTLHTANGDTINKKLLSFMGCVSPPFLSHLRHPWSMSRWHHLCPDPQG